MADRYLVRGKQQSGGGLANVTRDRRFGGECTGYEALPCKRLSRVGKLV